MCSVYALPYQQLHFYHSYHLINIPPYSTFTSQHRDVISHVKFYFKTQKVLLFNIKLKKIIIGILNLQIILSWKGWKYNKNICILQSNNFFLQKNTNQTNMVQ